MFKLIKVDFYDDFACMMSDCPDNCCDEEWDIYIDDDTIKLYEEIGVADLSSKITMTEPHKLIKHNGKCPFITPEGLCMFHRDYGEDYLSNTCRSYPRFVSTYGDVYLETLGLSCPATVRQVLKMTRPVSFPDKIYYENDDEVGKRPDNTPAENMAYSVIRFFESGQSMIGVYIQLYGEMIGNEPGLCSKKKILSIVKEQTSKTPSERYAKDLFKDEYLNNICDSGSVLDEKRLFDIEEKLNRSSEFFSCNVNRMIMFEHLMLESASDVPDVGKIILQGFYTWIMLLIAFDGVDGDEDVFDEDILVDRTYRLMRIMDHGGSVIGTIIKNFSFF